jgi:hypothetical protein
MRDRYKAGQLEREGRRRTIANGKSRFIRRQVGFSLVFFATLMSLLYFFSGRTRSNLIACLAVLPVGILGGYLEARWRWRDITKEEAGSRY